MKSAVGIQITPPLTTDSLGDQIGDFISKTGMREGMIYLQLTRGVSPRNHLIPDEIAPTLLFYARPLEPVTVPGTGEGVSLLSLPDERWKRCWVKSIALLPNVLAKNAAVAAGADEAVFVDLGLVTECSTSNLFAVIGDKLVTHPVGTKVLPGITRQAVLEIAGELGIEVDERAIREEEAPRADELFITSTTREISWVSRWNDTYIGQGRCGPTTLKLHQGLVERIRQETGVPDLAAAVA
jgi:D-alanine transaminase